jgi:hypothetical protein
MGEFLNSFDFKKERDLGANTRVGKEIVHFGVNEFIDCKTSKFKKRKERNLYCLVMETFA